MEAADVRVYRVFQAGDHPGHHSRRGQQPIQHARENGPKSGKSRNDKRVKCSHDEEEKHPRQYLQRLQGGLKPVVTSAKVKQGHARGKASSSLRPLDPQNDPTMWSSLHMLAQQHVG